MSVVSLRHRRSHTAPASVRVLVFVILFGAVWQLLHEGYDAPTAIGIMIVVAAGAARTSVLLVASRLRSVPVSR